MNTARGGRRQRLLNRVRQARHPLQGWRRWLVIAGQALAGLVAPAYRARFAAALVRRAGHLALRMRAQGLDAEVKTSVSDVVTEADRTAERFVAEALQALRGDDGVIGEEGASRPSATGRTWVIDPVDGTYNFSQGSDYFCSALALVDDNSAHTPAIGAVRGALGRA